MHAVSFSRFLGAAVIMTTKTDHAIKFQTANIIKHFDIMIIDIILIS